MRFLCDVHIPIGLSKRLATAGHESVHVNQLPAKWHTPDKDIARLADEEDRILITKDADFRDSAVVQGTPRKLIKVNLGNIPHLELTAILLDNLERITRLNENPRFLLEVDKDRISVIDI
jgi:predicted nuclease of predicted toxin-antitoxin system